MSDIEDPINEYSVMINTVCVLDEPKAKKKPIDPKTPYLFVYSRL